MNIEELIERLDRWYMQTGAPSYWQAAQGLREQQAEIERLRKWQCDFTRCQWRLRGEKAEAEIERLQFENDILRVPNSRNGQTS